jgi:hypothetical protein
MLLPGMWQYVIANYGVPKKGVSVQNYVTIKFIGSLLKQNLNIIVICNK